MASKTEPLLTIADLDACPDDNNRYELIEGELFVSRAPALPHQRVLHKLQMRLGSYLQTNPIGILVPGPGAVFSDYDAVIPDIVFVRNERWESVTSEQKITGAPDIIVEILSPGSESHNRDFIVKRQLYAKYGVAEYWVIDIENRNVSVFRLKTQTLEEAALLSEDDEVSSPLLPGFKLSVEDIFKL